MKLTVYSTVGHVQEAVRRNARSPSPEEAEKGSQNGHEAKTG